MDWGLVAIGCVGFLLLGTIYGAAILYFDSVEEVNDKPKPDGWIE